MPMSILKSPSVDYLPAPVLIVEDEPLMRAKLLHLLLELGYEENALVFVTRLAEARSWLAQNPAALALVDLGLPDGNGLELIAEMRESDPALSILVVSSWSTEEIILQAGATGYVLKERDDMEMALSIRSVLRGGAPIDPFIARRILHLLQATPPKAEKPSPPPTQEHNPDHEETLTRRESGILQLVAEGLSNREIAERLFLSRHTIECHIKHIYRKLAVSGRTRAVYEARARGLLS
ncbi:MAG: response regulator transcription factor [Brachymonas denitrificans]